MNHRAWSGLRAAGLLLSMLIGAAPVDAQESVPEDQVAVTLTLAIPEMVWIDVPNRDLEFPVPGASDIRAGAIINPQTTPIDFHGNVPAAVWVAPASETMTRPDGTPTEKPMSDVEWTIDDGSTWHPLSIQPILVARSDEAPDEGIEVGYRIRLDRQSDRPGIVQARLIFTVAAL